MRGRIDNARVAPGQFSNELHYNSAPPLLAHDGSLTAAQQIEALGGLPGGDEAIEW